MERMALTALNGLSLKKLTTPDIELAASIVESILMIEEGIYLLSIYLNYRTDYIEGDKSERIDVFMPTTSLASLFIVSLSKIFGILFDAMTSSGQRASLGFRRELEGFIRVANKELNKGRDSEDRAITFLDN